MIRPDKQKVSKQFINYLRDAPMIPLTQQQGSKQRVLSMHDSIFNQNSFKGPIEGDFSKIGTTYTIQKDKLKKKSSSYGKQEQSQNHIQMSEEDNQQDNIETIKQVARLEYLEKKGFLKPDEMQRLSKVRNHGSGFTSDRRHKCSQGQIGLQDDQFNNFTRKENAQNQDPNAIPRGFTNMKSQPQMQNYPIQSNHRTNSYDHGNSHGRQQTHIHNRFDSNFNNHNYYEQPY